MAANQRPVFALKPVTPTANLSGANTATAAVASPADGTDFRLLYTCGVTEGAKLTLLAYQFIGTGTPSAGIFYIWITDTAGANARIIRSSAFLALSGAISTTLPGQYAELTFSDLQIQNGQKIFVSVTTLAANTTLNVRASLGEFA